MNKVKIGDTIKIIKMEGEPQYTDREGVVEYSAQVEHPGRLKLNTLVAFG